jgi:hypothetical protein
MLLKSGSFYYLRETDVPSQAKATREFVSPIEDEIPNLPQLCQNIMSFPQYNFIKDTDVGKKIKQVSELTKDDFLLYFTLFNTFTPTDEHRILQPIFKYKSEA